MKRSRRIALRTRTIRLPDGRLLPPLTAEPGARVVIRVEDRRGTDHVFDALAGLSVHLGRVFLGGVDLACVHPRDRRVLLGFAARGMQFETGPLRPGRGHTVRTGEGQSLTAPQRARLLIAGAMRGDPPLLLLDHIDADLGASGRRILRSRLAYFPGVVVIASDDPEALVDVSHVWRPAERVPTRHATYVEESSV